MQRLLKPQCNGFPLVIAYSRVSPLVSLTELTYLHLIKVIKHNCPFYIYIVNFSVNIMRLQHKSKGIKLWMLRLLFYLLCVWLFFLQWYTCLYSFIFIVPGGLKSSLKWYSRVLSFCKELWALLYMTAATRATAYFLYSISTHEIYSVAICILICFLCTLYVCGYACVHVCVNIW